eukprot:TRINITY_DN10492_c0_g1_i1.p2 TRINITY_DN10492_c0_g1~~TRINITY_DN10492_c0_g1_i1.p2  ORF type:complete len:226 (-),score=77.87 TRINITY_DN10492_c0_g1_i1:283-888(-)
MARASAITLLLAAFGALLVRQWQAAFVAMQPKAGGRSSSLVVRYAEATEGIKEDTRVVEADENNKILMSVLTPEGSTVKEAVSEVVLPSASGQLGVLAGHAPMMTALDTGVLRYKKDGKWFPLVLLSGFAKVEDNKLNILVNDIEQPDSIDLEEAKKDLEEATDSLGKAESKADKLSASGKVKKASARVQAVMFMKGGGKK